MSKNTSIVAAGEKFDVGCRVVLWDEPEGLSFYKTDNLYRRNLDLDGNLGLAQDFFAIFKNYDGFYLNKIAKIFGDIFSYGADCVDSTIRETLNTKHKNLKDMFICYIEDELQVTATTEEIRDFNDQVDKIRLDCDRLEARIHQLISG